MELEKLTALQLGEKIKQRQVSVLDGVKTVFEQIEKQDSEVHAYLDTYKEEAYKRAEEVQKGIEEGTYTSWESVWIVTFLYNLDNITFPEASIRR